MEMTIDEFIDAKELGMPGTGGGSSKNTLRAYKGALERVERYIDKPLKYMTVDDTKTLLEEAKADDLSVATVNQMVAALRVFFQWAELYDLFNGKNPAAFLKSRYDAPKDRLIVTKADVEKLIAAFHEIEDVRRRMPQYRDRPRVAQRYALVTKLLFFGGLRISEALTLEKQHVHAEGVLVNGKGDKQRFIPLPDNLIEELKAYVKAHPTNKWVFTVDGQKPMDSTYFTRVFRGAATAVGISDEVTPHSLRHAFATLALKRTNGNVTAVQDILGHSDPRITRRYARNTWGDLKQAMNQVWGEEAGA